MKTICKKLILIAIPLLFVTSGMGQENDFIARLKAQLLFYRTQKTNQFIFVQTDKSLYRQGETIWMKGYVTDAITHTLSPNSLELSVQLIDNKGVTVSEGKFMLKNGVADLSFAIPQGLPSDVYYLVAYTPEMENGDIRKIFKKKIFIARPEILDFVAHLEFPKPFFAADSKEVAMIRLKNFSGKPLSGKKYEYQIYNQEHELLSGKGKTGSNGAGEVVFFTPHAKNGSPLLASLTISSGRDRLNLVSKIPLASEKINVRFYPEGGNRVPGRLQTVVYEAEDQLGNPVDLNSDIIDEQGTIVVSTKTTQPGLGVFSLQNSNSGKLTMRISSDIGKNQEILLPALSPGSISLSLKKNDGKILTLLLGRSPESKPAMFEAVAVTNGELIWAAPVELKDAGVINVPLTDFHDEVAAFAIFNQTGALVAQRLIYTGKGQSLNVTLIPDKSVYKTGEEGVIRVKITDQENNPVKAELAISLSDKYSFPATSMGIESLSCGLSKAIPTTGSVKMTNSTTIDYLLAGNTFNGFDWEKVLAIDPAKGSPGKTGAIRISGTVVNDKRLPVPYALVSLTSSSLQQFNTSSDQNGEFSINLPISIDKKNLSASATDSTGKWNYEVEFHKSFKDELVNSLNKMSVNDWQILDQIYQSNYFRENPDYFKARPSVKGRGGEKRESEVYWKKYLNGSSSLLEIIKAIRPYEMSGEKIVFRGMNSFVAQDGALIVIDGARLGTDASQLSLINPMDVEDIRILVDPAEMGMYTGLNTVGVIEIKTKHGTNGVDKSPDLAIPQKESVSKLFTPEAIGDAKYDLKTTLQWIPVLFTDEKGEATIPFRAGGIKSTFVLGIAGFSDQREWIGKEMEIKVEQGN